MLLIARGVAMAERNGHAVPLTFDGLVAVALGESLSLALSLSCICARAQGIGQEPEADPAGAP